ncbi:hypothetical protein P3T76_003482 [Phytophthora citrophthora]|uniref:Uncharacterized protein n=1 Tax=Phytophthora citrophthora TaxID=4793 RepID=A0AAD9LSC4_9STRA|nr:hypothetical protein P3T76_003482 [Phytophthora citrophthora]
MEGRGHQDADGVRRSGTFSGRQVPLEMGKVRVGGSGRPVFSVLSAAASRRASVNSSQEAELPPPRVTLEPHPRSPFRRKEELSEVRYKCCQLIIPIFKIVICMCSHHYLQTLQVVSSSDSGSRFKVKKATGPHLNARSPLKTIRSTSRTGKDNSILMRSFRDDAMEVSSSSEGPAQDQAEATLGLREQVALNTKGSAEDLSTGNNTPALHLLLTEEQPEESTNILDDEAQESNSENTRPPELPRRTTLVLPAPTGTFVSSMPSLTKVRSSFTARELALFTQRLETSESDGNVQIRYHVASHPHSTAATLHSLPHRSNQDQVRAEEIRASHKHALSSSKSRRESNNVSSDSEKVESTWKRVDTSIEHIYQDPSIDMIQQYLLHSHHTTRGQKKRKMMERERALAAASDLREHQSVEHQRQEKLQQRKLQLQKMSEAIRLQNQKSVRPKAVHSSEMGERRTRSSRRAESAPTLPERKPPVPRLSRPGTSVSNMRKRKPKTDTSRLQGGVSTSILMGSTSNSSENQQNCSVKDDELVDEKVDSSPADHVAAKRKPTSNTPRSSKKKKQGVIAETPEVQAAVQAREERRAIAREYMQLQKHSRKVWSAKAKEQSQREQEKRQQKLEILEATRLKKLRLSRKRSKEQKNYEMEHVRGEPLVAVGAAIPSAHDSMIQDIATHDPAKGLQHEDNRSDEKALTLDESDVDIENDGGIGNVGSFEISSHHGNRTESFYDQAVSQNIDTAETDDRVRKLLELREKAATLSARLNGLRNQTRTSDVILISSTRAVESDDDEFRARVKYTGRSKALERDSGDGNDDEGETTEQADDTEESERGDAQATSSEPSSVSDTTKPSEQEGGMENNAVKEEMELFSATETLRVRRRTEVDAGVYEVDESGEDIDIRSIGVYNIGVVWPLEQQNETTIIRQTESSPLDRSSSSSSSSLAPASPVRSEKRVTRLDEEENVVNDEAFELEFYQQMKNRLKSSKSVDEVAEEDAAGENEDGMDSTSSSESDGHLASRRRFYPADRDYKQTQGSTGQTGDSNAGLLRLIRETDDSLSVVDRAAKRLYRQQLERSEHRKEMELQERMEAEKKELLAKDLALKTVVASISGDKSVCSDSVASDVQSNAEEDELQSSQCKCLEEIMDEVEKERARENEAISEPDRDISMQDETEQQTMSTQRQNVITSEGLPVSPSSAFWDQLVADTTDEGPDSVVQREYRPHGGQTPENPPRLSSPRTLSRTLLAAVDYQETIFEAHMQLAMMEHSHKLASVRAETITLAQVFKEEMENNSTAQLEKKVDSYMDTVMQQLAEIRQKEEQEPSQRVGAASSAAVDVDRSVADGEHKLEVASSVAETSYAMEYASDDDFYEESFEKDSQRKSGQQFPTSDVSVAKESRSKSLRESESESEIQSEEEDDFYDESFERDSQLQTAQHLSTSDASIMEKSRSKSLSKSEIESEIQSVASEKDIDEDFGVSGEKNIVEETEESAMEGSVRSEVENEIPSGPSVESKADEVMSVNYEEDFEASSPKARVIPDHLSQDTVEDELESSKRSEDSAVESEVEDEDPSSPTDESKAEVSMSMNYEEDFEVSSPKMQAMSDRFSQDTVEDELEASKSSEVSANESTMEDEVPSSPTVASKADVSMSINYDEDFETSSPKARATSDHLSQDTVEDELEVSKSSEESENSGDIEEEVGENDSVQAREESATEHVESDYYSSQFDDATTLKSAKKSGQFTVQTQDQPKQNKVLTTGPNELRLSEIPPSSTVSAAYVVDLDRRKQAEESLLALRLQTVEQKYQRELRQLEATLGNGQDLETRKETLLMAFLAEKANIDSLKAASTARYYQDLHAFRSLCLDWPHTMTNESNRGLPPYFSGQTASFVPVVPPAVEIAISKPSMLSEDDQDTSTRHEYTDDFGSDAEAIEEESNDKVDEIVESRSISSRNSQVDEEADFEQESDGKSVSVQEEEQEEEFEQESEIKSASSQEEDDFEQESEIKSASVEEDGGFEQESESKPSSVQEEEDGEDFDQENDDKSNSGLVEEEEYEDEFDSMNYDASAREDIAEVVEASEIGEQEDHSVQSDSDYDEDFASITESTPIQRASSPPPDETEVQEEGLVEEKSGDGREISSGSDINVQEIPASEDVDSERIADVNKQNYSEDDFESGQLERSVVPPTEHSISHRMDQSNSEDSSMTKLLVAEVATLQEVTGTMRQTEREDNKLANKKAKVEELLRMKERLLNQQTETFRRTEEKRQVDVLAKLALGVDVEEKLRRAKADISQQLATEFDTLKQTYPMLRPASAVPHTGTAPMPSVMSKLFGKSPSDRATALEERYEEEYEAESFEEELDQDGKEVGLTKPASVDVASYEVDEVEAENFTNDILSDVPDISHEVDVEVTSVVDEEEDKTEEKETSSAPSDGYENEYENESFDEAQSVPDSVPDGDEENSVVEEASVEEEAVEEPPVEDTRKEDETLEQSGYSDEDAYSDEAFDNASELSTTEAEKPGSTHQVATTHESIATDAASGGEESASNDEELTEAIETVETQLERKQAVNSAEPELDHASESVLNVNKALATSVSGSVSRDEIGESLTKSIEERNVRLQILKQKVEDRKREILAVQKKMRVERRREKLVAQEKTMLDEMEAVERLLHADEVALDLCQQRNRLEMMHLEARERELSTGKKLQQIIHEKEIDLLHGFDYIEDAQTDGKQQRYSAPAFRGHTSRKFDLLYGFSYIEVAEPVAFVSVMNTPQVNVQPAEARTSGSEDYAFSAQDALVKEASPPLPSSEHVGCDEEGLDDMKSDTREQEKSSFVVVEKKSCTQSTSKLEITDESIVRESLGVEGPVDLLADYAFVEIAEVVSCFKSGISSSDLLTDYDYVEIAEGILQDESLQSEAAIGGSADDHNEFVLPPGSEGGCGVYETEMKAESERGGERGRDFMVGSSVTQAVKSSAKPEEIVFDDNARDNVDSVEESIESNAGEADTGIKNDLGLLEGAQQSDVTRHEVAERISTLLYADVFQEIEDDIMGVIRSSRLVQLQPDRQLPTLQGALPESPQSTLFSDGIGEESIDSRYTADWSVEQSSESVQVRSPKMNLPCGEDVSEEEEGVVDIEESTAYANSFAEESFLQSKEDPDVLEDSSSETREEDVLRLEQGGGSNVELDKQETLQIPSNFEPEAPMEAKTGSDEALQRERVADAIFGAVFDEIVNSELQLWSRQPPPVPHLHISEQTTEGNVKAVSTAPSVAKSTPESPMRTHIQNSRARDQVLTQRIVDQLEIVDGEIQLPAFNTFNFESDFFGAQALYDTVEDLAGDYFRAIQQSSARIDSTSVLTLIRRSIHTEIGELLAVRAQSEYELERQLQLISDESGAESGFSRDILLSQNCIASNVNSIVSKVQSDLSRTTEELSTAQSFEPSVLPRTPIRRAKSTSILSSLQTQQAQELQQRITGMILSDLMRDAGLP